MSPSFKLKNGGCIFKLFNLLVKNFYKICLNFFNQQILTTANHIVKFNQNIKFCLQKHVNKIEIKIIFFKKFTISETN